MIITSALLLAALGMPASTSPDEGLSVAVAPDRVSIVDLAPGVPQSAQVSVRNTGAVAALLTVRGQLETPASIRDQDRLAVTLEGCAVQWLASSTPSCPTGAVSVHDGALVGVPLGVGEQVWVLITAALSPEAGDGAQGQTWTAQLSLTAAAADPQPAHLATTGGAAPWAALAAGLGAIAAGAALTDYTRRRRGDESQ